MQQCVLSRIWNIVESLCHHPSTKYTRNCRQQPVVLLSFLGVTTKDLGTQMHTSNNSYKLMTTISVSSSKQKDCHATLFPHPLEYDVVCAKDHFYAKHTGNLMFRDRIEATKKTYRQARTKQEKKKVTKDFVNYLQSKYGSRFLKRHGNDWIEISDLQARDKVSHALRFATRLPDEEEGASNAEVASGVSSNSGCNGEVSSSQSSLTVDSILDDIFKRQQELLRSMQEGQCGDEILPNTTSSTSLSDSSSSSKCPPRRESFVCFEQKVKSIVVDPPVLRSHLSDVLFSSEPLTTSLQLECQNQQQLASLLEPVGSTNHAPASTNIAALQEDLTLDGKECDLVLKSEDMHQLLSEALGEFDE